MQGWGGKWEPNKSYYDKFQFRRQSIEIQISIDKSRPTQPFWAIWEQWEHSQSKSQPWYAFAMGTEEEVKSIQDPRRRVFLISSSQAKETTRRSTLTQVTASASFLIQRQAKKRQRNPPYFLTLNGVKSTVFFQFIAVRIQFWKTKCILTKSLWKERIFHNFPIFFLAQVF